MLAERVSAPRCPMPPRMSARPLALRPAPTPLATPGLVVDEAFRAHAKYVWTSLRRLGVREADLEDLTHDVFVVVHRKRHDYDATRPLRPWLFGIAANCASDYRRKASHRRERLEVDPDAADTHPRADEHCEQRQRLALVQAALAGLSDAQRAVFVMHELDGFSVPDIAHALAIPLNTGYSRLRLARVEFGRAVRRLQLGARGD